MDSKRLTEAINNIEVSMLQRDWKGVGEALKRQKKVISDSSGSSY